MPLCMLSCDKSDYTYGRYIIIIIIIITSAFFVKQYFPVRIF